MIPYFTAIGLTHGTLTKIKNLVLVNPDISPQFLLTASLLSVFPPTNYSLYFFPSRPSLASCLPDFCWLCSNIFLPSLSCIMLSNFTSAGDFMTTLSKPLFLIVNVKCKFWQHCSIVADTPPSLVLALHYFIAFTSFPSTAFQYK